MASPASPATSAFVLDDRTDSDYLAVRDVVRRICDRAAANGQTFALETGQESAEVLLRFLEDTGRGNLRINFDPRQHDSLRHRRSYRRV